MASSKAEYPPLFDPGWHTVTINALRAKCVTAFPRSSTRKQLFDVLAVAIEKIKASAVPCELWIDGSYLTEKIDPSDVDVALIIPANVLTAATPELNKVIKWIVSDDTYEKEKLDGVVLTMFPMSSALYPQWEANREYWEILYGTQYDNLTPKGVCVMRFRGGAK